MSVIIVIADSQKSGAVVVANSISETSSAYGSLRSLMPDHIYIPEPNAQIYTSPSITAGVSTPFDAFVAITACRQSVSLEVGTSAVNASVVAAGARARFLRAPNARLVIFQFNPFHSVYPQFRRLQTALQIDREKFADVDVQLNAAYEGRLSLNGALELCSVVANVMKEELPSIPHFDSRVQEAMFLLFDNPRLPLEQIAAHCQLSYDRMSHLFIDELGISIRSFQVWVKLHRALTGIRHGQSLIELAQIAGFSDAAHLSRVYKQVYGAPPSYFYYSGNVKLVASFAGPVPGSPEVVHDTAA